MESPTSKLSQFIAATLRSLVRGVSSGRSRTFAQDEAGLSMVEFAISLSVFLSFVFMMMELCLLFYSYSMISERAREGTRWAIVRGATCQTSSGASCTATATTIQNYVTGLGYPNPGGGTISPVASFPDGNQNVGSRVRVTVTYSFPIRMPFVPKAALPIATASEMYIVQ